MKKIYIIAIMCITIGFILLIPSFILDFIDTIFLLLNVFGITLIVLAILILSYPKEV